MTTARRSSAFSRQARKPGITRFTTAEIMLEYRNQGKCPPTATCTRYQQAVHGSSCFVLCAAVCLACLLSPCDSQYLPSSPPSEAAWIESVVEREHDGGSHQGSIVAQGSRAGLSVNQHVILHIQVSVHCSGAIQSHHDQDLDGHPTSVLLPSPLDGDTTWSVTTEELPSTTVNLSEPLRTNDSIRLRWADVGSSIYHGQATLSLVLPLVALGQQADTTRTLVVALIEHSVGMDAATSSIPTTAPSFSPRIVTRRLANVPIARGSNPLVTVDLTGTSMCYFRSSQERFNLPTDAATTDRHSMYEVATKSGLLALVLVAAVSLMMLRRMTTLLHSRLSGYKDDLSVTNDEDGAVHVIHEYHRHREESQIEPSPGSSAPFSPPPALVRRRPLSLAAVAPQFSEEISSDSTIEDGIVSPPILRRQIMDPSVFGNNGLVDAILPLSNNAVSAIPSMSTPMQPRRLCFATAATPSSTRRCVQERHPSTVITCSKSTCIFIDSDEDSDDENEEPKLVQRAKRVNDECAALNTTARLACPFGGYVDAKEMSNGGSSSVSFDVEEDSTDLAAERARGDIVRNLSDEGTRVNPSNAANDAADILSHEPAPEIGLQDQVAEKTSDTMEANVIDARLSTAPAPSSCVLEVEYVSAEKLNWLQRLQNQPSEQKEQLVLDTNGDAATMQDEPDDFSYVSTLPPHSNATASERSIVSECIVDDKENVDPVANRDHDQTQAERPSFLVKKSHPTRTTRPPFNPLTSFITTAKGASLPSRRASNDEKKMRTEVLKPVEGSPLPEAPGVLTERADAPSSTGRERSLDSDTKSIRSKPAFVPDTVASQSLITYSKKIQEPVWRDSPAPFKKKGKSRTKNRKRGPPLIIELLDVSPRKKKKSKHRSSKRGSGTAAAMKRLHTGDEAQYLVANDSSK